jgi:hypothetical protein
MKKYSTEHVLAGTPRHLALAAGRGLLVREVSLTNAPRPSCAVRPSGGAVEGPNRSSGCRETGKADWYKFVASIEGFFCFIAYFFFLSDSVDLGLAREAPFGPTCSGAPV